MSVHSDLKKECLSSLLLFTRVFYKLRNSRNFELSRPTGRECHYITIAKELTQCFLLKTQRLIINIPPGLAKSTMLKYFAAWGFAHFEDCQFIYISYSHDLASKHTADIKSIMSLREYQELFGVEISRHSSAKDNFQTTGGGALKAFGSRGAITGQDAGLPHLSRFSGALLMDDLHKPDEVHSDTIRQTVIRSYNETMKPRGRSPLVPYIFIGQRLHEDDLAHHLISGKDGYKWKKIILKGLDDAGNSIHPDILPLEKLKIEEKFNPYVYASQIQQTPFPAGGGLFKESDFVVLDEEPEIIASFVTIDTAETEKSYNDASVFSFWGLYAIRHFNQTTNIFGLHWLDCIEIYVEPKDLICNFTQFYSECMRHPVKPSLVGIEKKSTGVSLISSLSDLQGINLIEIKRTAASGSKADRFISIQPYIARKQISFTKNSKHLEKCITHMSKITANNSHRHDDIADTCFDAIDLGLIRAIVSSRVNRKQIYDNIAKSFLAAESKNKSLLQASRGQFI